MNGVVYAIIVAGSEKFYIGSTAHFKRRQAQHLRMLTKEMHHCISLQRSVAKRGLDAVSFTVLEEVDLLFVEAREQFWLWRMRGSLHNVRNAVETWRGAKRDDAFKAARAAALMGNRYRRGMKMSAEAKAKISASLAGNERRRGILHDDHTKERIGVSLRRAYAEKRKIAAPQPQNLTGYNAAYGRGEIKHPRVDEERAARIINHWHVTKSFKETATEFGVTGEAIAYIVRKYSDEEIPDQRKRS